jgi:DNA adenine methylase
MTKILTNKKREPRAQAFLRWIGGKRLLVHRLLPCLPAQFLNRKYHEPFAGAANLFFALAPRAARVSDLNEHLIECYRQVRDNYEKVAAYVREHERRDCEDHYYEMRDLYNRSAFGPAQAARFIYLNHTCFNGVFRVNRKGAYNVPYGDKPEPAFPSSADLARASKALRRATLSVSDYGSALTRVRAGDFVYLDPPYPPLNGTSFFTHYTPDRFDRDDQERLAAFVHELNHQGSLFMMTNADLTQIRRLYAGFKFWKLSVTRYVSCKGARYKVNELVITNYEPQAFQKKNNKR